MDNDSLGWRSPFLEYNILNSYLGCCFTHMYNESTSHCINVYTFWNKRYPSFQGYSSLDMTGKCIIEAEDSKAYCSVGDSSNNDAVRFIFPLWTVPMFPENHVWILPQWILSVIGRNSVREHGMQYGWSVLQC